MRVYFDNAATTPIRKQVIDLMSESMVAVYGNPSSTHGFGRAAKYSVENSRKSKAKQVKQSKARQSKQSKAKQNKAKQRKVKQTRP